MFYRGDKSIFRERPHKNRSKFFNSPSNAGVGELIINQDPTTVDLRGSEPVKELLISNRSGEWRSRNQNGPGGGGKLRGEFQVESRRP